MLLDRSNIKKWLKARKFEIEEQKSKDDALNAKVVLSKQRVVTFALVGGEGHYKNYVTISAKMKWNSNTLFYHALPSIVFHFYLPIEHTHVDKIFKMMVKWTKFAFEEYKNKRLTL